MRRGLRLLLLPIDLLCAGGSVLFSVSGLLWRAKDQQAAIAQELEARRRGLNDRTASELERWVKPAVGALANRLETVQSIYLEQIELESEIEHLLDEKAILREPALRANATSAVYQIALLLHRTDIRCTSLALGSPSDEIGRVEYKHTMSAAAGDLDTARQRYADVFAKYIEVLEMATMRRERLSRRLIWLLTFQFRLALDRDAGVNDLRQELQAQRSAIEELRTALKVFRSEFFTHSLRTATTDFAGSDDAQFIEAIAAIVEECCRTGADPADLSYPILVSRVWAIRQKFLEIPAWSYSMRWRAYTAGMQAWLYHFAANGAALNQEDRTSRRLRREASDVCEYASLLVTETALLERPFKPIFTSFSNYGRQKVIPGFGKPLDRTQIIRLIDRLRARLKPPPRRQKDPEKL